MTKVNWLTTDIQCVKELFDGYDGDYKPQEVDWGAPTGDEI